MSYLSEPTLADTFPSTLQVNGVTYTKSSTDNLTDGVDLTFQWCLYENGSDWLIRFAKPDVSSSPTRYFYDQITLSDAQGESTPIVTGKRQVNTICEIVC